MKMRYSDFAACIFDFDGVIIDSEPLHAEAKRLTLAHFGVTYPGSLMEDWKGRPDAAFFDFVASRLAPQGVGAEAMHTYKRQVYLPLFEDAPLVPGALEFLRAARASFPKLGLATSATRRDFGLAERKYGLGSWFDVIVTGDDSARHKPDPDPYLRALAGLGVAAPAALAIEDSPNGVRSAVAAGCRIAALTTGFQAAELASLGAGLVVDGFSTLARELGLPPIE